MKSKTIFHMIAAQIKRIPSRVMKLMIWSASFLLLTLVLVQMALAGGVWWLHSEKGQAWLETKIQTVAAESGYDVHIAGLYYSFPQALTIKTLEIADEQGAILSLAQTRLQPKLWGLSRKHLDFSIQSETFTLHRLPKSKSAPDEKEDFSLLPFTVPDLYFTSLSFDDISVKKFEIKSGVFGQAIMLSPVLKGFIKLDDSIGADMSLFLSASGAAAPTWMPERVDFKGRLQPQTMDVALAHLKIKNDKFQVTARGTGNLGKDDTVDLKMDATIKDLAAFAKNIEGRITLKAALQGALTAPFFQAQGTASLPLLKERGMDIINFTLSDPDLRSVTNGSFTLESLYQNMPLTLAADFDYNAPFVAFNHINGRAPDAVLEGDVTVNTDNALASGRASLIVDDIQNYAALAGVDLAGSGTISVDLSEQSAAQNILITASGRDVQYDTIFIKALEATTEIVDINHPIPTALALNAKGIKLSPDVTLSALTATIADKDNDVRRLEMNASGAALQPFTIKGGADIIDPFNKDVKADNIALTLSSEGSSLRASGWADMKALDIMITSQDFDLSSLPVTVPAQLRDLRFSTQMRLNGAMNNPVIAGDIDVRPLAINSNGATMKIKARALYEQGEARIDIDGSGTGIDALRGSLSIPLQLSFIPFVMDAQSSTKLSGEMVVDTKARSLAPLLLPPQHSVRGDIQITGALSGTIGKPDMSGQVSLQNGTYIYNPIGIQLYNIDMRADINPAKIEITKLHAEDGNNGVLNGQGIVSIGGPLGTRLGLRLKDFDLLDSDIVQGTMSADLDLKGVSETAYLLAGEINLGKFDVVIPEQFQSTIPVLNKARSLC
jgi:translocation and assembly module TamB